MSEDFEILLLSGHPAETEQNATALLNKFNIGPTYLPEMGRELNPFKDWVTYRKLKKIIRDFKPDIVHTHAAKPGVLGRLAAHSLGVPVVLHTYHGHVFNSYFSRAKTKFIIVIERWLAKKSTQLIAISPLQKKELVEEFEIAPANKFEVIPIGLYLEPFQSDLAHKRKKFRNTFGLKDEDIVISIVGRLAPIKNHKLFVKAIWYLQSQTTKNFVALVVGDGECRGELEQLCYSLGVEFATPEKINPLAKIIFTSWRTDIDHVNAGSDIIALTSLNEGTPVSLIEAQASGKPIVATDCGGIKDVVLENETALLSDPNDANAFFQNLKKMIEDESMREAYGKRGPQWAQLEYGHQNLIEATQNLYYKLLRQKNQSGNDAVKLN